MLNKESRGHFCQSEAWLLLTPQLNLFSPSNYLPDIDFCQPILSFLVTADVVATIKANPS